MSRADPRNSLSRRGAYAYGARAGRESTDPRAAFSRLTTRQCEYLNLRAEGLKLREIAELHGVTIQSVAETCARAIEALGKMTNE